MNRGTEHRIGEDEPAARVEFRGGVLTAAPAGPHIGSTEAPRIQSIVAPELDRAGGSLRALVLDLSAVASMNSMGLGLCIELRNRAHRQGSRCFATGLQPRIAELFHLMKVDRLFELASDENEVAKLLR